MKNSRLAAAALLGTAALTLAVHAASLGDPAAPLSISDWVKGGPVTLADGKGKKIYVVEFWATWCPPCRTSIPHLTELQKKFKDKDVVVIGVSDEKLEVVKPFVAKMGDKMDYVVAIDKDNATSEAYMKAFDQNGIPHAFIVDKQGRIVWQGHPMAGLDKAVEELVEGKFDLEKSKKRAAAEEKMQEFAQLASTGEDDAKLAKLAKELEALEQELGNLTPGRPFNAEEIKKQLRFNRVLQQYQQALFRGGDDARLAELEKTLKDVAPPDFNLASVKKDMDAQKAFMDYFREVTGDANEAKLAELTKKVEAVECSNAQMLNQVAWTLLTEDSVKKRDAKLACKLAKTACDLTDNKDASILDTYARALFDCGKVEDAIAQQKKAIALCTDDDMRKDLEANLKTYEAKK